MITENQIQTFVDKFDNEGFDAIKPENLTSSEISLFMNAYENVHTDNYDKLELIFITLYATWYSNNELNEDELFKKAFQVYKLFEFEMENRKTSQ